MADMERFSALEDEILLAGRRLYEQGLVVSNDGNISAMAPDGTLIVTPTGVSKGYMTREMLIRVDMEGNVISGGKPSSELGMHLRIYRENERIKAVVHAHPPIATVFASAGIPLDSAILQETVVQLGIVPVAEYALPGSDGVGESAARFCMDYNAVLLEYHGAVTWGDSVSQALHRMESVEYYARALREARLMGIERPMTQEQINGLIELRGKWGVSGGGRPQGR